MNALVYGLKRSGYAAAKLLILKGENVFVLDDKPDLVLEELDELVSLGCKQLSLSKAIELANILDLTVVSPSVSKDNLLIEVCNENGVEVMSELELGYRYLPKCNIVAITGTNGKTTTTEIIHHIQNLSNKKSHLLGNGGVALCGKVETIKPFEQVVLEVSSFQLEWTSTFHPKIAAILNITPDHLDRHKTMENYISEKAKIFSCQNSDDYVVLNADDLTVTNLQYKAKGRVLFFSCKYKVLGCYLEDGFVKFFDGKTVVEIVRINEILLVGAHNIQNVMCAAVCAYLCGFSVKEIADGVKTFMPLPHRCQPCGILGKVKFVNDSKATNIESALPQLTESAMPIVAIVGGSDKGENFERFFLQLSPNVSCIFIGSVKEKLIEAANCVGFTRWQTALNLDEATKLGYLILKEIGGTVTLSPCCASFDAYRNFEHRGEEFVRIVNELIEQNI